MSGLPNAFSLVHISVSGATVTRGSKNVMAEVPVSIAKVTIPITNLQRLSTPQSFAF